MSLLSTMTIVFLVAVSVTVYLYDRHTELQSLQADLEAMKLSNSALTQRNSGLHAQINELQNLVNLQEHRVRVLNSRLRNYERQNFHSSPKPKASKAKGWRGVLGFPQTAKPNRSEIKAAYHREMKKYHPDSGTTPDAKLAAKINEAREQAQKEMETA